MDKILKCFILSLLATRIHGHASGYRNVVYFTNWSIYSGRNFTPQALPASNFTHVLYAFAKIMRDTGEVVLSDRTADTEIQFAGDLQADNNLYGCLKQLYLLKKENRNLKTLLAIGGSTYSSNFSLPASTPSSRSIFAKSAVSLVTNLGFDGLDIDWEYPANDSEASNFVLLLQEVREALDTLGNSLNPPYRFTLTVASSAGPSYYQQMHLSEMDQYVDFWNLMAYDYAGQWSTLTGNQANLFTSQINMASTPFDTKTAVNYYVSQGITRNKIILGMPIYGRSFEATDGLGKPFSGVGDGTWETGIYDFKDLPLDGASEAYDSGTGSSYSYDTMKRQLISYDTVAVAKQKASWVREIGLGGLMWWEGSADRIGNGSLVSNAVTVLRGRNGSELESSPNQLLYSNSTFANLRAGMPGASLTYSPTTSIIMSSKSISISTSTLPTSTITLTVESLVTRSTVCGSSSLSSLNSSLTKISIPPLFTNSSLLSEVSSKYVSTSKSLSTSQVSQTKTTTTVITTILSGSPPATITSYDFVSFSATRSTTTRCKKPFIIYDNCRAGKACLVKA